MNPQDPLATLHPLREPTAIGWWPLAPGWWVLVVLTVLALLALAYYLRKQYRKNAYRRLALKQLGEIRSGLAQLSDDVSPALYVAIETNALIKAVALRVFPRHDIAALSGEAWLEFLNKTGKSKSEETQFPASFANAAYRADTVDLDAEQLFMASEHWIKMHRTAE